MSGFFLCATRDRTEKTRPLGGLCQFAAQSVLQDSYYRDR